MYPSYCSSLKYLWQVGKVLTWDLGMILLRLTFIMNKRPAEVPYNIAISIATCQTLSLLSVSKLPPSEVTRKITHTERQTR
jgi:hypothetical protein